MTTPRLQPEQEVSTELDALLDEGTLEPVAVILLRLTGRRPSPSTVWRWCRKATGRAGVLPARLVFGQQHSTEAAVREWLARKSVYVPRTSTDPGPTDDELRSRGLLN